MTQEIAQIQIVPVENGFFIQCINIDGSGQYNPRKVANNREELEKVIKEVAEQLYTKEPPPRPGTGQTLQPTIPNELSPSPAMSSAD